MAHNVRSLDLPRGQLLTASALAKRFSVSRATIYRFVREEGLPHYKIGSSVRFDPEEVEAWVEKGTNAEIAEGN